MTVLVRPFNTEDTADRPVIHMYVSGTLERSDYDQFVPELEEQIKRHGKVDLLVELSDFHGWTAGAMWEDTKFGIHHFNDIRNMAVIGDQNWEQWLARFARAFTTAKVRYFNISQHKEASEWVCQH